MMRHTRRHVRGALASAAVVASLAGLALGAADVDAAGQAPMPQAPGQVRLVAGPAGTLRAAGAIRHRQLRADGSLAHVEATPTAFVLERRESRGRWTTTMSFPAAGGPVVRSGTRTLTLENPFAVARVELDEARAETRAFDRAGRPIMLPTDADRRRFGILDSQRPPGWDTRLFGPPTPTTRPAVMAAAAGAYADNALRDRRRLDLQQKFGRPAGRVRGLDRYLRSDGQEIRELLVAPDSCLPQELNVVTAGVLTSRLQMQYARAGGSGYVRQLLRSERPVGPSAPGELVVTDITFADIEVAPGGAW